MKTPTLNQFQGWAKEHQSLALAVCKATAFAQVTRERVDEYTAPIFQSFKFKDEEGQPIEKPGQLYLCKDEDRCKEYYAEKEIADRAHGWGGEEGYCPALVAEHNQIKMEQALIFKGAKLMGIKGMGWNTLENRKKMLDLLLGACRKR